MDLQEDNVLWRQAFMERDFNVDKFLTKFTQVFDLETLKKILKVYGHELYERMAQILKTETECIVNLAVYLTSLNSKIHELFLPVCLLCQEIKVTYELIQIAQENHHKLLVSIKKTNVNIHQLNLKLNIIESSIYIDNMLNENMLNDSIILERAVNKFSFQYTHLDELKIFTKDDYLIVKIRRKLTDKLNKLFLTSFYNGDKEILVRCLRMYDNLGQQNEAEYTIQINVIRPGLKNIFTENHLELAQQNLSKLYEECVNFLDINLKILIDIINETELVAFNFILNSFWIEIDKLSRDGLPNLTAPGNPELFISRYLATWNFIHLLSKRCGNDNLIKSHKSFISHLQRFNLPVYFEIKYQQIACEFEKILVKTNYNKQFYISNNNEEKLPFKLIVTQHVWECFKKCYQSNVFVDDLSVKFFHLAALIFARYFRWFELILEESKVDDWDKFIINSLIDFNLLINLFIKRNDNLPIKVLSYLPQLLKLNKIKLDNLSYKLKIFIVDRKYNECIIKLQNVSSIPRLYRRTNRLLPTTPSNYVITAIDPINQFYQKLQDKQLDDIINMLIIKVTNEYSSMVKEVLLSVCKTEESLRRLKNRNPNIIEENPNTEIISDEMKIRKQIELDVNYLLKELYNIGMDDSKKAMDKLKNEIVIR